MSAKIKYLLFLILPSLLFLSAHILKVIQGPYYLNFYDPGYVYLINALNLAQLSGYGVGHFDHPGTTVQTIAAFALKLYHFTGSGNTDIVRDVLSRPEEYLFFLNKVFVTLSCIALYFLGLFTYRITGNILISLLVQLSPFASTEIFYGLIIVTPDNFLVFISLIFIASLIYYLFALINEEKIPVKLILIWGIICGAGIVTKLNFLPVAIIPFLMIKGIKGKSVFTITLLITFTILFLPALSNTENFLNWIEKLFIHSGRYGNGEANIINESTYFSNIRLIFLKDKLYFLTYLICAFTLIISFVKKINFSEVMESIDFKRRRKLLFVIFISMNFQILLVAKHYNQYYMIPSFMLCAFVMILSSFILVEYFKYFSIRQNLNYLLIPLIVIFILFSSYKIIYSYYEGEGQRLEAEKIVNFIEENYQKDFVISGFGSADPECALAFGVMYAGSQSKVYNKILYDKLNSHIFYNPWINQLYSISDEAEIRDGISRSKKIILQIGSYGSAEQFANLLSSVYSKRIISYKEVFKNKNGETVYEFKSE